MMKELAMEVNTAKTKSIIIETTKVGIITQQANKK